MSNELKTKAQIVAVGAGRMGRGIGHIFAFGGYPVTLLDVKQRSAADFEKLEKTARSEIRTNLELLASMDVLKNEQIDKAMKLITVAPLSDAANVLAAAGAVIEGVPETLEAKESALKLIGEYTQSNVAVLSTTSSMLVIVLQDFIAHPERFLNAHFLNPAFLIPLVEISPGSKTEEKVVDEVFALLEGIGKIPVRCAATPGYIIPRLQSLVMSEACRMVDEGVATAEEIDKAITCGFGPRYTTMGLLEFIDYGGLDTHFYASHRLAKNLNSPAHAPPPSVDKMMARGDRGMHAGQGYYHFKDRDIEKYQQEKLSAFVTMFNQLGHIPKPGV
ncbi:MAG: 3-hydroxyacyl-CoA dehydrogenase [Gammaproteobacteria bacterium]|nr:3-hydroxyacyl-CoA dehydrogenase [Gammaproteobacteria bacterium]